MKPLDCIEKRDLLAAQKFDPEKVRAYADAYLREGRHGDAFEFYRKLGDVKGVTAVKEACIREAEPDVLWQVEKSFPDLVSREDWITCGENAMGMGKYRCAAHAFQHARDDERLARAEAAFKVSGSPQVPPAN